MDAWLATVHIMGVGIIGAWVVVLELCSMCNVMKILLSSSMLSRCLTALLIKGQRNATCSRANALSSKEAASTSGKIVLYCLQEEWSKVAWPSILCQSGQVVQDDIPSTCARSWCVSNHPFAMWPKSGSYCNLPPTMTLPGMLGNSRVSDVTSNMLGALLTLYDCFPSLIMTCERTHVPSMLHNALGPTQRSRLQPCSSLPQPFPTGLSSKIHTASSNSRCTFERETNA